MNEPFKTGQRVRHKVTGEKGEVVICIPSERNKGKYSMEVELDNGVRSYGTDEMFEEV